MIIYSYNDDNFYIHHSLDKTPDPDNFPMHVHEKCELFYFISGKGSYTVEGNDYALTPGSIMLMRGAETHKLHIDSSLPYERFVVHFSPDSILNKNSPIRSMLYDRPLGYGNMIVCSGTSLEFISSCFDRIRRAITLGASEQEISAHLIPVLYELTYSVNSTYHDVPSPQDGTENLVGNIISYINNNLAEIKNMEFIEQNFYFSRSYLNKIFKSSTGSTIWEYIIVKRLMKARSLIQSGKSVLAASAECGFSDYSSFYRQYKQKFGTSPVKDKASSEKPYSLNKEVETE